MNGVAIVTGGANGIGRAVALRLARDGFVVEVVDLDVKSAENVRAEIAACGGEAQAHGVDATNAEQVKRVVAEVIERRGRVDALANIAGGTVYLKRIEELTWEEWKEDLDRNLKTTFLFCREVAPIMIRQRSGRIVNTASAPPYARLIPLPRPRSLASASLWLWKLRLSASPSISLPPAQQTHRGYWQNQRQKSATPGKS